MSERKVCACGENKVTDDGWLKDDNVMHTWQKCARLCGRCLGEVPCGCYSHESRLGLPFPSPQEVILEEYREQWGRLVQALEDAGVPFGTVMKIASGGK